MPPSAAGKTFFTAPSYVPQRVDGAPAYNSRSMYNTISTQRALSLQAGATGTLMDKFNWDVNYTHGESRQKVRNPTNTDNARLLAAQDAVIAPAGTTVNGVSVAGDRPVLCHHCSGVRRPLSGLRADEPVRSRPRHLPGILELDHPFHRRGS